MSDNIKKLYDEGYFTDRFGSDEKRLESFQLEKEFIAKYVSIKGACLDIGCSTGEFLENIGWSGKKYGIEISETAANCARKSGIEIVDAYNKYDTLDAIFYRGTIQHLDSPFRSIKKAAETLKPGGFLFFIATPNADSWYFKTFGTLPALDPERNFYIPSRSSLINVCSIFGLSLKSEEYPYLKSPYSRPAKDHILFLTKWALRPSRNFSEKISFPFWKNMMNLVFVKR